MARKKKYIWPKEKQRAAYARYWIKHRDRLLPLKRRRAVDKRKNDPVAREEHCRSSREWRNDNPELARAIARKQALKKYGITPEEYDKMLEAQGGKCAICRSESVVSKYKHFCVDHCHVTGKVRGLLCGLCNQAVGMMHDNADRLRCAADYLDARNIA